MELRVDITIFIFSILFTTVSINRQFLIFRFQHFLCVVYRRRDNPLYVPPTPEKSRDSCVTSSGTCLHRCLLILVVICLVLAIVAVVMAAVAICMLLAGACHL